MESQASAGWRARVGDVEALSQLTPITGWEDKPLVSLAEATAALPVKAIAIHSKVSFEFGEDYKANHPADPRTADQLGAVYLYTCAWAVATDSLYAVLNAQLGKADRGLMKVWFLYLKLLMTALAMEPPYVGTLWRGVSKAIGGEYIKGKKFRWWRFSSCTEDGDVLKNPLFLGENGERTLFSIDCKTGVKIQHLSAFPIEAEILIPAGTRFEVAQTITTGPLTIVNLKEIDSGLQITQGINAASSTPAAARTSSSSLFWILAVVGLAAIFQQLIAQGGTTVELFTGLPAHFWIGFFFVACIPVLWFMLNPTTTGSDTSHALNTAAHAPPPGERASQRGIAV
eukprot:COSAG01_NODE_10021_length_2273_cov_4.055198_3_plen_342_part_00